MSCVYVCACDSARARVERVCGRGCFKCACARTREPRPREMDPGRGARAHARTHARTHAPTHKLTHSHPHTQTRARVYTTHRRDCLRGNPGRALPHTHTGAGLHREHAPLLCERGAPEVQYPLPAQPHTHTPTHTYLTHPPTHTQKRTHTHTHTHTHKTHTEEIVYEATLDALRRTPTLEPVYTASTLPSCANEVRQKLSTLCRRLRTRPVKDPFVERGQLESVVNEILESRCVHLSISWLLSFCR